MERLRPALAAAESLGPTDWTTEQWTGVGLAAVAFVVLATLAWRIARPRGEDEELGL